MTADRVQLPDVWSLTWRDVDPAGRPGFDPAAVPGLVRSLPPVAAIPPAGTGWQLTSYWFDRMTEALVERLGVWAVGWTQSIAMEEYEDRGPVPTW